MNKSELICNKARTLVGVIGEIKNARATIIVLWNKVPEYMGCKTVVLHMEYIEPLPVGTKVIKHYKCDNDTVLTYKYYNSQLSEIVGKEGAVKAWNLDGTITLDFEFTTDNLLSVSDVSTKNNKQYTTLDIEPWDIMQADFTREEFIGFLKGNIIKYCLRKKGSDLQDFEKIEHYARKLQEVLKDESN